MTRMLVVVALLTVVVVAVVLGLTFGLKRLSCPTSTREGGSAGPATDSAINGIGSCYYPGQLAGIAGGFGLGSPPVASSLGCAQLCKDHPTCTSWHRDNGAQSCWGYAATAADFARDLMDRDGEYDSGLFI